MTGENPFNSTKRGNLFVGYERLRGQLLNGFRNDHSFAVLGGRRCGKTSLLMQIERDLQGQGLAPFTPLPRFLDVQGLDQLTPALLFETIYCLIIRRSKQIPGFLANPAANIRIFWSTSTLPDRYLTNTMVRTGWSFCSSTNWTPPLPSCPTINAFKTCVISR